MEVNGRKPSQPAIRNRHLAISDLVGCAAALFIGYSIRFDVGIAQTVNHLHVHVIPRTPDDGFDIPLPFPGSAMPDRTVLDVHAARIIAAFRDPMAVKKRVERRGSDRRQGKS